MIFAKFRFRQKRLYHFSVSRQNFDRYLHKILIYKVFFLTFVSGSSFGFYSFFVCFFFKYHNNIFSNICWTMFFFSNLKIIAFVVMVKSKACFAIFFNYNEHLLQFSLSFGAFWNILFKLKMKILKWFWKNEIKLN